MSAVEISGNKDNRSVNCTSIRTKHRDRTRNLKMATNHPETAGAECPVVSAQSRPILTSTSPDTHPCPYPIPHKQAPHLLPGMQTRVLETSVHLWLTPPNGKGNKAGWCGVSCPSESVLTSVRNTSSTSPAAVTPRVNEYCSSFLSVSHQQTEISNLFRMWGRMSLGVKGLIGDAGGGSGGEEQ